MSECRVTSHRPAGCDEKLSSVPSAIDCGQNALKTMYSAIAALKTDPIFLGLLYSSYLVSWKPVNRSANPLFRQSLAGLFLLIVK